MHSPSLSIRDPNSEFTENANVASLNEPTSDAQKSSVTSDSIEENYRKDDVNNFVTYESREIGISLNYPSSWFAHKLRNSINYHHVTFLLPPKKIGSMQYYGKLDLLGGSSHLQGVSITQIALSQLSICKKLEGFSLLKHIPFNFTTLGSNQAQLIGYLFKGENGDKLFSILVIIKKGDHIIMILFRAPYEIHKYVLPMLKPLFSSIVVM